jgi:hypothetical protein
VHEVIIINLWAVLEINMHFKHKKFKIKLTTNTSMLETTKYILIPLAHLTL